MELVVVAVHRAASVWTVAEGGDEAAGEVVGDLGQVTPLSGSGRMLDGEVGAAGSTGRGEANLYNLCSFLIVEEMRRGVSPKDAGMTALKRVAFGGLELGRLRPGEWRDISKSEIAAAFGPSALRRTR